MPSFSFIVSPAIGHEGHEGHGGHQRKPLGVLPLCPSCPGCSFNVRKKQVRWPVWHTFPSPRRLTLSSTVSSSQSTRISTTSSLLPDVSPFVQSVLRVRLKNVA